MIKVKSLRGFGRRGAPRKKRVEHEFIEQCKVAQHLRNYHPFLRWTATLNGVPLSPGAAAKAKAAGNQPGIPDLLIFKGMSEYVGLAIEMKRIDGGVLSQVQRSTLQDFAMEGWRAVVCAGADAAIAEIESYLSERSN